MAIARVAMGKHGSCDRCIAGVFARNIASFSDTPEGIGQNLYYVWSREFMEAGKRRLAGDTARAATSGEVQDLRREARALKEVVADLTLESRLLKISMIADGGEDE